MDNIDKKFFGARLKEIRKSKGLTQEKMSEITGIELSNYSKIETGRVSPSLSSLQKIIEFAEIEPNELFNYTHLDTEQNLDNKIKAMYETFSLKQKRQLYKIMRSLEEF
jgi:transcriptional regulator with XRE-family HTH domain